MDRKTSDIALRSRFGIRFTQVALCAALLLFSTATLAQKKSSSAGGGSSTGACSGTYEPATSNIFDADSTTSAAYDVQSDSNLTGSIAYSNSDPGVCSAIWTSKTSSGWELSLLASTRTFRITLDGNFIGVTSNQPAAVTPGTGPAWPGSLPWDAKNVTGKMEDKCYLAGNDVRTMTTGAQFTCPAIISQIPTGITGDTYTLAMTGAYANAPDSTLVQFTCNSTGSDGYCNDWSIDPVEVDANGNVTSVGSAVATLVENVVTKRTTTQYNDADYTLTFHIHVTRQ